MEKINKSFFFFTKVEILINGALVVDGGDGIKSDSNAGTELGGGTGGVIQIISPMGNLSAHSLYLRGGKDTHSSNCNKIRKPTEANGYYYLQGV